MRIHPEDKSIKVDAPITEKAPCRHQTINFTNILKEKLECPDEAGQGVYCPKGRKVSAVVQLKRVENEDPTVLANHIEELLEKLDVYRLKLNDIEMNIESARPLIDTLNMKRERLALRLYHLSENDGVKDILKQVLSVAAREIKSFEDGTYAIG